MYNFKEDVGFENEGGNHVLAWLLAPGNIWNSLPFTNTYDPSASAMQKSAVTY